MDADAELSRVESIFRHGMFGNRKPYSNSSYLTGSPPHRCVFWYFVFHLARSFARGKYGCRAESPGVSFEVRRRPTQSPFFFLRFLLSSSTAYSAAIVTRLAGFFFFIIFWRSRSTCHSFGAFEQAKERLLCHFTFFCGRNFANVLNFESNSSSPKIESHRIT